MKDVYVYLIIIIMGLTFFLGVVFYPKVKYDCKPGEYGTYTYYPEIEKMNCSELNSFNLKSKTLVEYRSMCNGTIIKNKFKQDQINLNRFNSINDSKCK